MQTLFVIVFKSTILMVLILTTNLDMDIPEL